MTATPAAETRSAGRAPEAGSRRRHRAAAALPYVAAVAITLFVCRDQIRGRYFGDIGDARWTVSLHEHWFRVWQGQEGIRDLLSYVPLRSVLGTSDAFLVQGQVYSVFRALGVDLAPAWAVTQVVVFLVGALGVAALSRRLFRWAVTQAAFTVLVCSSYPFVVDLVHVQLIGMLAASWVVVGLLDLARCRHPLRSLALVLVVPPLIALSSWYALVLLVVVLGFVGGYLLVVSDLRAVAGGLRASASSLRAALLRPGRVWLAVLVAVASAVLVVTTAWIYLPAKNLLPEPTWEETTLYSPWYSDILNAGWLGGGVWGPLYARYFDPSTSNVEQPHGFTPVLFVAVMALGLYNLRRAVLARPRPDPQPTLPGPRSLGAIWLAVLSVALFFVVDERGLGPFMPVFDHVPGMDSIRAPFRVQTFGYALAFLILLRSAELIYERLGAPGAVGAPRGRSRGAVATVLVSALVVAAVFVEGQRPFVSSWNADQLLAPSLVQLIPAVRASCDAVIVDTPSEDKAQAQIDGVTMSTLAGVVTPQGYGRAEPVGHPPWTAGGPELAAWMRSEGFPGRICSVSETSTEVTLLG